MCFVYKHMQNADFGQILCRRASTKRHMTSRPMVCRISANLVSQDSYDLKERTHEKACHDLWRSRGSHRFLKIKTRLVLSTNKQMASPFTIISKVQVETEFPEPSVAVYVTVVVPIGKGSPEL